MAIIGFIFLVLIGLFLIYAAGVLFFAGMFMNDMSGAFIPLILAVVVFWAALHWAPFTITFVGG
jgi:hypothetical protein